MSETDSPTQQPAVTAGAPVLTPREGLDFGLDGDIPRHWFAGDAFKTRLFDAMSTLFPEGERFFIACVRDYRDKIEDPIAKQLTLDFARQEAQHGKVHAAFNKRLSTQGIKVDRILSNQRHHLFDIARRHLSKRYTLALTAACEHLTAVMAENLIEQTHQFTKADPRMRALFVWHGIEEIEHKAVAFDIMQHVARVGYFMRAWALVVVSIQFPLFIFQILNHMLKVDGYTRAQRLGIWLKGLYWLYGPGGLMRPMVKSYLSWFRPGFHPWHADMPPSVEVWEQAMSRTGDPIKACDVLHTSA